MNLPRADFRENLLVALGTLRSNKVRSLLTILGIVIGVTSVISVAAIITGLNDYIQKRVEELGSRTFYLGRIPGGQRPGDLGEKYRLRKYFSYGDAARIREAAPAADIVTSFASRAAFFGGPNEIRYKDQVVQSVIIRGAEPEYLDVLPMFQVADGRFISQFDESHARRVVVLGTAVADSLFGNSNPVGREVILNAVSYEVIGVFAQNSGLFGTPGVDQFAVTPLSEFRRRYPDVRELFVAFTVKPEVPLDEGKQQVTEATRRIRRVKPNQENDFEVISPDFLSNLWNQLTGALVILTSVISSIGLLVGGVGVMNIMLISVTERTSEIGVRKALGARKSDILTQFLMEALTLTLTGGLIGLVIAAVISLLVRTFVPGVPASLSLFWVAMGIFISVGTGVFFGLYPATRAANLDPIQALRYE